MTFVGPNPDDSIDQGTMRVEKTDHGYLASGDLYHSESESDPLGLHIQGEGIPWFPIKNYRFYLKVQRFQVSLGSGDALEVGFQTYEFDARKGTFDRGGLFTALLKLSSSHGEGLPNVEVYDGPVVNRKGRATGSLRLEWISSAYRRARIGIHSGSSLPRPMASENGCEWKTVFGASQLNWEFDVTPEPAPELDSGDNEHRWTLAQLHQATLKLRERVKHPAGDWQYDLLCVSRIEGAGYERGVMFDWGAVDVNHFPREGAALAAGWPIPEAWGQADGTVFGQQKSAYFRAAVHEMGHAMGLDHNYADNGFMNTTDVIVDKSASLPVARRFPTNIDWRFHPRDRHALNHGPDIAIRPGGLPWESSGRTMNELLGLPGDQSVSSPQLQLAILPPLDDLPLGAPVRLEIHLINRGPAPAYVPSNIALTAGVLRGSAKAPDGTVRTIRPLAIGNSDPTLQSISPGERVSSSVTLLRGSEGPLFPISGRYEIELTVGWFAHGRGRRTTGRMDITVGSMPQNPVDAELTRQLLNEPEVMLALIMPGDVWKNGNNLIERVADSSDSKLARHYRYFYAKRWAHPSSGRIPDYCKALKWVEQRDCVLTSAEAKRVEEWRLNAAAVPEELELEVQAGAVVARDTSDESPGADSLKEGLPVFAKHRTQQPKDQ